MSKWARHAQQISFNGARALARGQKVRAKPEDFSFDRNKVVLQPGTEPMEFVPAITESLHQLDPKIFSDERRNLARYLMNLSESGGL